ncbi:MarR family transcriptional regulator [bacterium]|nr:MarR family transcriptional regulator [bacterium]
MNNFNELSIKNQLCFALYACSREINKLYTPILDEINLTYTQYISMLVLWEKDDIAVKDMGDILFLDSGTLTPVIKSLEKKGLVKRNRSTIDERIVNVTLTKEGLELKEKAKDVPAKVYCSVGLDKEDGLELYRLCYKVLDSIKK